MFKINLNPVRNIMRSPSIVLSPNVLYEWRIVKWYCAGNENMKPSDKMTQSLKTKFPLAKHIEVVDVSGGCGSMYEIYVESTEFQGLSTIKQHRLINEVLKDYIKQMHGLRIRTKIPEESR